MTEILINNTLTNILNDFFYYNDDYEDPEEKENVKKYLSKVVKDNLNDFSKEYYNNLKENNLIYCSSNWDDIKEILNLSEELKNTKLELKNIKSKLRDAQEDLNNSIKTINNLNEEMDNLNKKLKHVTKLQIQYKDKFIDCLSDNDGLIKEKEELEKKIKNNYVSKNELEKIKHNLTNFFDDLDNHIKELKEYHGVEYIFLLTYKVTQLTIHNFKKFSDDFFENNLNNIEKSDKKFINFEDFD
jgi:chromosome segregation ATPase